MHPIFSTLLLHQLFHVSPWYSFPVSCLSSGVPHSSSLDLFLTGGPQSIRLISHWAPAPVFMLRLSWSFHLIVSTSCSSSSLCYTPILLLSQLQTIPIFCDSCFSSYRPWNCSFLLGFLPYIITLQLYSLFAFTSLILIRVGNHIGGCRETEFMLSKIA